MEALSLCPGQGMLPFAPMDSARILSLLSAIVLCPAALLAQGQFDDVTIKANKITDSLYMLTGSGGNLGVSIGDDGVVLIDDQYAPLTGRITEAIGKLSDKPIRFLINTHWHGDHTGGNENFGKAGTIIMAHENVRTRLSKGQFMKAFNRHVNPAPAAALPVVTFTEGLTLHWNADDIVVTSVGPAHTDGDSFVTFKRANVIHAGDLYFNGFYPFVDGGSGGSLLGLIEAGKKLLSMADDKTVIIPGHGPLSNKAELQVYVTMLDGVHGKMKALIDAGKSKEEIVAAKPTADYDGNWGGGFLKPDTWVGVIYDAMVPEKK